MICCASLISLVFIAGLIATYYNRPAPGRYFRLTLAITFFILETI